jgi:ATP-dependent NAD(P)H-hydrate dehydratase
MQKYARWALGEARKQEMYVLLDADALLLVGEDSGIIKGYKKAIITPNVAEFKRLCDSLGIKLGHRAAMDVSAALGGVTVLQKGANDIIAVANENVIVDNEGGMKRCGGQGDVLSGNAGTMLAWGKCYEDGAFGCVYPTISPFRSKNHISRRILSVADVFYAVTIPSRSHEYPFWQQ